VLEAVFILLEFPSPSRRIFIGSNSLPPSLVRRIGPSSGIRAGRGPLKQTGESPLKTYNKPKPNAPRLSTQGMAHIAVALTAHQGGPLKDPLEQAPPRSRAHDRPRAGSAPFEGVRLPRADSASLEGSLRPRAGSASLEGAPHAHA
jgi:hypothetical protein